MTNTLHTFKLALKDKPEIRFATQPNGTTVACYMVSDSSTFTTPQAIDCRGLTFSQYGKISGRPFHKFFNVGEREETRIENLDFSKLVSCMEKRDGSMIHTVDMSTHSKEHWISPEHQFDVKSKKSFSSDVANLARKFILENPDYLEFCSAMIRNEFTPIFEYTSPNSRIVLHYPTEQLTLLAIRVNETGEYLSKEHLIEWCEAYDIPLVKFMDEYIEPLKADPNKVMEETTDIEGWVLMFEGGKMVKFKTKWYLDRHRAMTFLRERDVVKLVLEEGIDDLKSLLAAEGADISEIERIETETLNKLNSIQEEIDTQLVNVRIMHFKEAAIFLKSSRTPYFGLIMSVMRGKEANIKEFFIKNCLPYISLRQINVIQSVGETTE